MPQRSWMNLTAQLHLEPLFQAHFDTSRAEGRASVDDPAPPHCKPPAVDSAQELVLLLRLLDVSTDSAALRCYAHVEGAIAGAVNTIVAWMSYLPKNCVKAMVRDGWHWST
jgi:hypothetical protein